MPASATWTVSTPIVIDDFDLALGAFTRQVNYIAVPAEKKWDVWFYDENRVEIDSGEHGFDPDDESYDWAWDDIEPDEVLKFNKYMSDVFLTDDWRPIVEGNSIIDVDAKVLSRMIRSSIEGGYMAPPLKVCDAEVNKYRISLWGSTDDEICPYVWDEERFVALVTGDQEYCIQSVATPSNDSDVCYLNVGIYRGSAKLKSYDFDFTGDDFSKSWADMGKLFNKLPDPDSILREYQETGTVSRFDRFLEAIIEAVPTSPVAAVRFFLGLSLYERAAQTIIDHQEDFLKEPWGFLAKTAGILEREEPIAASLLCRAIVQQILELGESKDYARAAKYFAEFCRLSSTWDNKEELVSGVVSPEDYIAALKTRHGRKTNFWTMPEVIATGFSK